MSTQTDKSGNDKSADQLGKQPENSYSCLLNFGFSRLLEDLQETISSKVINNCLENGLRRTLARKNIITQNEFDLGKAQKDVKTIQKFIWIKWRHGFRGNISQSSILQQNQNQLKQKKKRIANKVDSIALICSRIADKLQRRNSLRIQVRFYRISKTRKDSITNKLQLPNFNYQAPKIQKKN